MVGNQLRSVKNLHFTLQWHLTARCDQNCLHCYLREESSYRREIENELGFEDCIRILDDFYSTFSKWGMPVRITFTGGDPLLREDLFDLVRIATDKGIQVSILGNPNHLDLETAKELKRLGVYSYQISIDGMEDTHDYLRGRKGAFSDAIKGIRVLKNSGLRSVVMFTLSARNAHDLVNVIKLMASEEVSVFDFARLVPIGRGRDLQKQMLEPQEYRRLLLEVFEVYRDLSEKNCYTHFGRKDYLWKLLYQELGLLKPLPKSDLIYSGCGVGSTILTILADGTVFSCRRLPIKIGKVPKQSIKEVFLFSKKHQELREIGNFQKCSNCDLLRHCRGCPAVAYGVNGSFYSPDPQCWKDVN